MTRRLESQGEPGELIQILPKGTWPGKSLPGAAGLGKYRDFPFQGNTVMSREGNCPTDSM